MINKNSISLENT